MGRAAAGSAAAAEGGDAESHGSIEGSSSGGGPVGVSVPTVTLQGERPLCASYGPASALRSCGFDEDARRLEDAGVYSS